MPTPRTRTFVSGLVPLFPTVARPALPPDPAVAGDATGTASTRRAC
ncbi:hypothetical protein ACGFNV_16770 [Streptomyces sp. NPDC048751]